VVRSVVEDIEPLGANPLFTTSHLLDKDSSKEWNKLLTYGDNRQKSVHAKRKGREKNERSDQSESLESNIPDWLGGEDCNRC